MLIYWGWTWSCELKMVLPHVSAMSTPSYVFCVVAIFIGVDASNYYEIPAGFPNIDDSIQDCDQDGSYLASARSKQELQDLINMCQVWDKIKMSIDESNKVINYLYIVRYRSIRATTLLVWAEISIQSQS